ERRDPVGALLAPDVLALDQRRDAADPRADEDAKARAVDLGRIDGGVFHRHHAGRDGVLQVRIEPARFLLVDVLVLVEVADFAGDARHVLELAAGVLFADVELRDEPDARLALLERGPELLGVVAHRGQRPQARDDDATLTHARPTSCP